MEKYISNLKTRKLYVFWKLQYSKILTFIIQRNLKLFRILVSAILFSENILKVMLHDLYGNKKLFK